MCGFSRGSLTIWRKGKRLDLGSARIQWMVGAAACLCVAMGTVGAFAQPSPLQVQVQAPVQVPVQVAVAALDSSPAQPGQVLELSVTGLAHSIAAANTVVSFTPIDAANPVGRATPSEVADRGDGAFRVSTIVPSNLQLDHPASYRVAVSGTDSRGQRFSSAAPVLITIDPAASIALPEQTKARAGQTARVTIEGSFTRFEPNSTEASFGAGISVGGAAVGAPGPVTVKSSTEAVAELRIGDAAEKGLRDVKLTSGPRTVTALGAFSVEPALARPVLVSGGPYTGIAGVPVGFDGSRSTDPNASALTLNWNTGDNTTVSGSTAQHIYANPGTYPVTLTATDALGATAIVHTTATIGAAVGSSVSIGAPASAAVGQAVAFNAAGINGSDGAAFRYSWDFGDGSVGTGPNATHAYAAAGTYAVTLTVENARGERQKTISRITVGSASEAPVANPGGPYTAASGEPVQFGAIDSTGGSLSYSWSFGDGDSATGARPIHVYAQPGSYMVTLTVDDGHGGMNSGSTTVAVPEVKEPVANTGGPYKGMAGTAIDFSGAKSTDPSGYKLTYAWTFGDKTTATGVAPTHKYAAAGSYKVGLTVNDGHGGTAAASTTATVAAAQILPVASTGGPYTGIPGETIQFNGTSSIDPPGKKALTYAWSFGDKATATGAQPTHHYVAAGSYAVTLTVSDGVATATAKTTATINAVIGVTVTAPTSGTLTDKSPIAVSGTVAENTAKVVVNGETATVSAGKWTAKSVALREGVNLITATASDTKGATGTASVSVTLDTTPPSVSIVAPLPGAKVFSPQLTVSGLVSDLVAGTVNAQNVSVSVNGVAASVVNRSFSAPNILLSPGLNTIKVVATDKAGNTGEASVQVNYKTQITQQTILLVSGNGQSGVINSTLAEPLIAQLVAANGQPVVGRPVTFTVTRSDGEVEVLPSEGNSLSVLTDKKGNAAVLFKIGSRAGVGINQVTATSPGFMGQALFTATSVNDQPAFIHPVIGEHQRGVIGQHAPQPFQVIVSDRMGNPLANVPVLFDVLAGGGNIGNEAKVTQETNSDGKATVVVTLGEQEGIDNNVVSANFTGNKGSPVVFHSSGLVPGPAAQTTVTGVVLDNTNTPVKGATASLEGTNLRTTTNAEGKFTLSKVPVGTVTLLIDGTTSGSATNFPSLSFVLQALPGVANSLDKPIYLPKIDIENEQTVGGNEPVTLTMTGVPGVAFTVLPNSVTFPDGSHVGKLSVSQVKADMVPMEPVNGVSAPLVWTIQPAGAKFNPPIQVQLPNVNGMAPGTVTEIYQYDHDLEQFVSGGTARVSPDGSVIVSDPGFGIVKAGWGHQLPPPPLNNCTANCDDDNDCTQDSFTPPCGCSHTPTSGNSCGKSNPSQGKNSCFQSQGVCQNGACNGQKKPAGSSCDDGVFCTDPDTCNASGACIGKPIPDTNPVVGATFSVDLTTPFEAVKNYVAALTGGTSGSLTVSYSSSTKYSCCEQKQIKQAKDDQQKAKISLGINIAKVYVPQYTFVIPGTPYKIGPYASFGVSGDFSGTYHVNECTGNCIDGSFGVGGSVTVGYGGSLPGELAAVDVSASAGITMSSTIGCNKVSYSIGANDLKGKVSFKFLDGALGIAADVLIYQGSTIATGSVNVP